MPPSVDLLGRLRLQFVRGHGFGSWLISRMGFPVLGFSHVMVLLDDGTVIDSRSDDVLCVDGVKRSGVQHRPNWYEAWMYTATVSIPVAVSGKTEALAWAMRNRGARYDVAAILGFALGIGAHQRGSFICSAFADDVMRRAGVVGDLPVRGGRKIPASQISPDVLYIRALDAGGLLIGETGATKQGIAPPPGRSRGAVGS